MIQDDSSIAIIIEEVDSVDENEHFLTDEENDEMEKKADPGLDPNAEKRDRAPSMTVFMVGKTFQWISRAKVAAWFRVAFNMPDTSQTASEKSSPERRASPLPKSSPIHSPRIDPIKRGLTLEPSYKSMFGRGKTENFEATFNKKSVAKMMRSASGTFSNEMSDRLHSNMLQESCKLVRHNSEFHFNQPIGMKDMHKNMSRSTNELAKLDSD